MPPETLRVYDAAPPERNICMHYTRSRFLAAASTASALAALGTPARAQSTNTLIRMGGVPTDDICSVFWAIKNGLYKKAGIDFQYTATNSGSTAITAVVAGATELGKGSLLGGINGHLKNLPIHMCANGAVWNTKVRFNGLLTAADQKFTSGKDFNGKVIGVPALNDLNSLVISAWTDQHGGDATTLKFVEIPNSSVQAALLGHRIDAAALQEPELTAALETKQFTFLGQPYDSVATQFVFGGFFVNNDWAAKNDDALKAWIKVTLDAAQYVNTHHAETVQLMADVTKLPVETIAKMARVENATNNDPQLIQPLIDAAAKYKMIPRSFPAKDMFSA
jgi:NitT/TauT family transport system substrate-binding protein